MDVQIRAANTARLDLDLNGRQPAASRLRSLWIHTKTSLSRSVGTGTSTMPKVSGFSYLRAFIVLGMLAAMAIEC